VIAANLIRETGRRHELHLVVLDPPGAAGPERPVPGLASERRLRPPPPPSPASRARRLAALVSSLPAGLHAITSSPVGRELEETVRRIDPDVVQLSSVGLSLYGRHVPAAYPRVLVALDSLPRIIERLQRVSRRPVARLRLAVGLRKARNLERRLYPTFGAVVMVSELDAEVTRQVAPRARVRVVPHAVDVEHFAPVWEDREEDVLGMVGNYAYPPNRLAALRLLGEVLPAVRRRRAGARALLVGANPTPDILELARETPGAEVTGFVDDVREHLRRMTVAVVPLPAGSGVKTKVLEAMASGLPVVGSAIALEGIAGTPGVHFVRADDAAATVDAVCRLLEDPRRRVAMGRSARELVERDHSWAHHAARYEELWASL
jgi:glycosyltransferase involved in cell wall biosynthesis